MTYHPLNISDHNILSHKVSLAKGCRNINISGNTGGLLTYQLRNVSPVMKKGGTFSIVLKEFVTVREDLEY
jgi:hypothetical protein